MRVTLLGLASLLCLAACSRSPRYQVYATGYTAGQPSAIPRDAALAVVEDESALNPLLEHEVAEKVRRALVARGFRLAPREPDILITLRYGADARLEPRASLRIIPGVTSTLTDSAGKTIGTATSPTTVGEEQTVEATELQWLTITARPARGSLAPGSRPLPLWIGETRAARTNLPLRAALDFLIVPTISAFGLNQPQQRTQLRADDPAVLALRLAGK